MASSRPVKKTPVSQRKATPAARKSAVAARAKKAAPPRPSQKFGRRADLGAPVDGFYAKQPLPQRAILDELRRLIQQVAPDAGSSIKWGMPFYSIGGNTLCALAAFKSHVNLILPGPPGTFADPDGRLEGGGTTGKHLKLRNLEDLPGKSVRDWLRTAADRARRSSS